MTRLSVENESRRCHKCGKEIGTSKKKVQWQKDYLKNIEVRNPKTMQGMENSKKYRGLMIVQNSDLENELTQGVNQHIHSKFQKIFRRSPGNLRPSSVTTPSSPMSSVRNHLELSDDISIRFLDSPRRYILPLFFNFSSNNNISFGGRGEGGCQLR